MLGKEHKYLLKELEGILFTAAYVERFNEMEQALKNKHANTPIITDDLNNLISNLIFINIIKLFKGEDDFFSPPKLPKFSPFNSRNHHEQPIPRPLNTLNTINR